MNLNFLLGELLVEIGDRLLSFGCRLSGGDFPAMPVLPSPMKHVLPIPSDGSLIGPWKHAPAVPLVQGTIPMPIPDPSRLPPAGALMTISRLIYTHNHALPFINGLVPDPRQNTPADTGSRIHEIDDDTAKKIALCLCGEISRRAFDLPFALAQIAIESAFDPKAEMGNFQGSNKGHLLDGYDMGLCQLKLLYLVGAENPDGTKVGSDFQAKDFALDIERAIPFFIKKLAGLVEWAKSEIPNLSPKVNSRFQNPYYLAAGAYNFGEKGVLLKIADGSDLTHCAHVANLCANFARALQLPNVCSAAMVSAP